MLRLAIRYEMGEFGYIVSRSLIEERDATVIQVLSRHLRDDPDAAAWCARHLGRAGLPPLLRDAIQAA
ncbi:hypothetical protein ACQP2F_29610 [Actinoplanes sp. CA-030573]|uniref:hypothetical protein n=1 Tax=Actinoplanes sp. CA-030573 TaxID=3239898 RepID=UPI003D89CEA7